MEKCTCQLLTSFTSSKQPYNSFILRQSVCDNAFLCPIFSPFVFATRVGLPFCFEKYEDP